MKLTTLSTCFCLLLLGLLSSCRSAAPAYDYRTLARAGIALGIDIDQDDNHKLYVEAAKWLGVPYRNGGNSKRGIDCSGLVSMAYLLNGIVIYRDAGIKEGFPIRPIDPKDAKPGDLLFFPGHVAMYLGEGRYVHSTGRAGDDGVAINSLDPAAPDFRRDLLEKLSGAGSYF